MEEKLESFNMPFYAASPKEVRNVTEAEGSFTITHLHTFDIGWDGAPPVVADSWEACAGRSKVVANILRAVAEPMLELHFGSELIMDELFRRYALLIQHYFSQTLAKYVVLLVSLTRKV